MSGKLFIVSTPIGNLGDITPRVKQALSESSIVLAEDTRVSIKLLHHLGVKTPLVSCHDFNESKRFSILQDAADKDQTVAIMSDAGTPLVSDPGYHIVQKAIELGMVVVPIPGPSSVITALVGSGLPSDRFAFEGFLPDKASERRRRLQKISDDDRTLVFFAAPNNLAAVLSEMLDVFGDRNACLARELTKLYEEFVRKRLSELLKHIETHPPRGEFVLVVAGSSEEGPRKAPQDVVEQRLSELLDSGGRLKDVASVLAKETGWTSSELYKIGLAIKEGKPDQS